MKTQISTMLTPFAKAFAWLWIVGFGIGAVLMGGSAFFKNDAEGPSIGQSLGFLLFWALGIATLYWGILRMKRVALDSRALYVSVFFSETSIPLDQIEEIVPSRFGGWNPITLRLRSPGRFGRTITFVPRFRFVLPFSTHPVVSELDATIKAAVNEPA